MIEGRCRCGSVLISLILDALPKTYACHCHQCQQWSGSAFSLQVLLPEPAVIASGAITVYERVTEPGTPDERTSFQRVCAVCHSRIYNTNTRRPGIAVVRAGLLDRSEELDCVFHIFTASRQRWFALPHGVPDYAGAPPMEAFALLR